MPQSRPWASIMLTLALLSYPTAWAQASPPQPTDAPNSVNPNSTTTLTEQLDETSTILDDGSYFNLHSFEGTAGSAILIDLISEDFDTYLFLIGPDKQIVADNDDGGGGTQSRIAVILPTTGTYQILVSSYEAGATGQYTLTWQPTTPTQVAQQASLDRATRLNQQALDLLEAGRYAEGTPLAIEALSLFRSQLGERHPRVATSLNNLAALYQAQGDYATAEPLFLQALEIRREQLGERHTTVADSLNNLALLYQDQGRYPAAEPLFRQALEIYQTQLGERHPAVANSLNNLAALYYAQSDYREAEPLFRQALEIRREQLGESHPAVAINLNNLALVYQAQGRYAEAEPLLREALAIFQAQLGDQHPDVAHSLNSLAALYQDQGRYSEAEPLYIQSLAILRDLLGEHHPNVATALHNLASLYQDADRYSQAEPLLRQALDIRREYLGQKHPEVAISLNNWANLNFTQGRYNEAEAQYHEALAIFRETLSEHHPSVATSLVNLSSLYRAQGKITQAVITLQQGLDIEEWNLDLNLATLTDAQRQDYVATTSSTTDLAISLNLQAAPDHAAATQLALTTLLRRKGRILDVGANSLQILRQHLTPDDQATLDYLTEVRRQLAALTFNPPLHLTPDQYRRETERLDEEANQLESRLARRSDSFRVETQPIEIATVQAQLPAKGVLVEYVRYQPFDPQQADVWGDWRYAAYLLFPDGTIHARDLGDARIIDAAVQAFSQSLREPTVEDTRRGTTLRTLILDPLLPDLQSLDYLLISPDSQLNRIPFEALPMADGQFLVEQYSMSYLNSGRDLMKLNLTASSQNPMLMVANPDYQAADSAVPGESIPTAQLRSDRDRSMELRQLQVGTLPGTAAEVAALQELFPEAIVLTAMQATENALKAAQAPQILHIATHGFFLANTPAGAGSRGIAVEPLTEGSSMSHLSVSPTTGVPVENPLLRSGLALAGFNLRQSGREDGVLTALEASDLDLYGTQLVVLSACETGLGDIANGEGVYGLRRAFALAGAESQLMSLWQVSDQGTQHLMTQYYQNLKAGMGRSEALRQVQLAMIRHGGDYRHPYYWAAFILAGDWRSLE